jgi:hypothetical protein
MPDPDRLLTTLRRAVEAFRTTSGRRGRLIAIDAAEVFATGDLHGNLDNLKRILQRADLARKPRRHLLLQEFIHGPHRYPGGGDKSHQALDVLAALKCQFPDRVHFLLGNHELSQWTDRRIAKADDDLNEQFRRGVETAYGERGEAVYTAYLELFAVVPLAVRTPKRVLLTHSLPPASRLATFDPAVLEQEECAETELLPGGTVHSLLWGRDTAAATAAAFLEKMDADLLITGHIPNEQGFEVPNDHQLILDSLGAMAGYCLFPADRPLSHQELISCTGTL